MANEAMEVMKDSEERKKKVQELKDKGGLFHPLCVPHPNFYVRIVKSKEKKQKKQNKTEKAQSEQSDKKEQKGDAAETPSTQPKSPQTQTQPLPQQAPERRQEEQQQEQPKPASKKLKGFVHRKQKLFKLTPIPTSSNPYASLGEDL